MKGVEAAGQEKDSDKWTDAEKKEVESITAKHCQQSQVTHSRVNHPKMLGYPTEGLTSVKRSRIDMLLASRRKRETIEQFICALHAAQNERQRQKSKSFVL